MKIAAIEKEAFGSVYRMNVRLLPTGRLIVNYQVRKMLGDRQIWCTISSSCKHLLRTTAEIFEAELADDLQGFSEVPKGQASGSHLKSFAASD